jgi:hypothetical protein
MDGRWLYRVYSLDGEFLSIASYDPKSQKLWPKKVFTSG